jgi:hypothetical protein
MTGDFKDFYLGTPMSRYEYMRISVKFIPDQIMDQYSLWDKVENGLVYAEIRRGMYSLPQAGRFANDALCKFLEPHGYTPVPVTPGLWTHKTRNITFTLVIGDFDIKYTARDDVEHLLNALKQNMLSKRIGKALDIVASPWHGITQNVRVKSPCPATSNEFYSASPTQYPLASKMPRTNGHAPTTRQSPICHQPRCLPTARCLRHQMSTRSCRHVAILRPGCRRHHAPCTRNHRNPAISRNPQNLGRSCSPTQLCSHPP